MDIIISPMSEQHIPALAEIENICFSTPWTVEGLSEELSNPQAHFLVALDKDTVVGYIGVQEICGEAYITNVAVLPEFRQNGIAKRLLSEAADGAKMRGCAFLTLEVRESNIPAISLYEKMQFSLIGKRKNFYREPTEDARIYTLYFKDESK